MDETTKTEQQVTTQAEPKGWDAAWEAWDASMQHTLAWATKVQALATALELIKALQHDLSKTED